MMTYKEREREKWIKKFIFVAYRLLCKQASERRENKRERNVTQM